MPVAFAPIDFAIVWARSSNRSATTTVAPSCTKRRAEADPMPPAPPVMMATLPFSRSMVVSLPQSFRCPDRLKRLTISRLQLLFEQAEFTQLRHFRGSRRRTVMKDNKDIVMDWLD